MASIDQTLLSRGTRGQEIATAPTLFQQTIPGLFANTSNIRFDETQGGRFKKFFLGGLFGPTKKEREANKREQVAEKAAINRRAQGIAGQLRTAGRGDVLQFPAARDAVRAAALGEEQGLADVQSFLGPTEAQREAGIRRQQVQDLTAEESLAAAQLEREGGRFGSGLDRAQFSALETKVGTQMAGASRLNNIANTVENLTDAEMIAIGKGSGGELQGQIEADLFAMMQSMQTLLEQTPSVLRKSDQELIQDALDNPSSFRQLLFSRESKTLGKIRRFSDILQEEAQRSMSSMDARTRALIAPVNKLAPSPFARPEGPDVEPSATPGGGGLFPGAPVTTEEILDPLAEAGKSVVEFLSGGR